MAHGRELYGRRMGILGLGRIGARVAEIAKLGLGMEVSYFSRRRRPEVEHSLGLVYLPRQDLIATSEVLSLHRTGPEAGEKPDLQKSDLYSMPRDSLLINTVHHGLVDPLALLCAIRDGVVRAAFDGIGQGDSWSRLSAMGPRYFLVAPSIAFDTAEANHRGSMVAADALCDVLSGMSSPLVDNVDFRAVRRNRPKE
jgi:lactate dehydrogenase-like 2-hydroxyacid dehydrogenase